MKTIQLLLFVLAIVLTGCEKIDKDCPACIIKHTRDFAKSDFTCETGASVSEYRFQDHIVYAFNPGCCGADMATIIYSENCESLGSLGGFTGNLKINDVVFGEVAVFQKTIWTN